MDSDIANNVGKQQVAAREAHHRTSGADMRARTSQIHFYRLKVIRLKYSYYLYFLLKPSVINEEAVVLCKTLEAIHLIRCLYAHVWHTSHESGPTV